MIDILKEIHDRFMQNEIIVQHCEGRMKFYKYPETADDTKPFIIISLLEPPREATYASDDAKVEHVSIQVDVEATDRMLVKEIQGQIKQILKEMNVMQELGGLDEYFDETKRFVDSRKYSGFPYSLYDAF
ncbi:DUF3168 domain-containing protein [Listeria booriae]|uniref:DUF3168 domain-containing protein n=1 Tax=Listeria booriae TaxID=1552123 RepID=UPI001624B7DE|nr:DUF3168 domain-containing protein [Listeria booriae]MBC1233628.1 DUF3168 domain-containing protein [Listeria booriae]MBC1801055.1 DUF3168 domain-containing protein [Listeria booriae]